MTDSLVGLLSSAIAEGRPLVLFAGQGFGLRDSSADPIRQALLERLGSAREGGWKAVFARSLTDADMAWLSERYDRNVPAPEAELVFEIAWSAVFTSTIDPRFASRFETRGRVPHAILSRDEFARVPRSRSRPPVHLLFGLSTEATIDTRAPRSRTELVRRAKAHAGDLLGRIPTTATARGIVVIDGYNPAFDWLDPDDLFAPLSEQSGLQVIWFGAPRELGSEVATEMLTAGVLLTTATSLAEAIATDEAFGFSDLAGATTPDEPGIVTASTGVLDVTPQLRLRVEASAQIVDDAWTIKPEPLSGAALDGAFRRFHGGLDGFRNLMEGVAQGFAIERAFEATLWKAVEAAVQQTTSSGVILLHGQSATGKSIALARLAGRIRSKLRLPVLVATARVPAEGDVDAFCLEAEKIGATPTVLLCDANQLPRRYKDLAVSLQSRGRRVIIVGSSYRIETPKGFSGKDKIFAPAEISSTEASAFDTLVAQYAPGTPPLRSPPDGWNILAWSYRHLSAGRSKIAGAVSAESRVAESYLRNRARSMPRSHLQRQSALAEQLIAAGLASKDSSIFADDEAAAVVGADAAGRLIDLVMVAGRLDCPVPLNLLMRILSAGEVIDLASVDYLFRDLDLFRWRIPDSEGAELLISPRLQLEAELVCLRRIADPEREIGYLLELIRSVRPSGVNRSAERNFVLDLLQRLDRDGPRGNAYRAGYLRFAEALRELRERHGVLDAVLMHRECIFRRQVIFTLDAPDAAYEMPEADRLAILDSAREVIDEAMRLIETRELRAGDRTRRALSVERATIYGYLAVQRAKAGDQGMWSDYLAGRVAVARATAGADDYHAFDVALWMASDVLENAVLSDERRAEILADLYACIELANGGSFDAEQQERYQVRLSKVADVVSDNELGEQALESLQTIAPATAAYLIARSRWKVMDGFRQALSDDNRALARAVADEMAAKPGVADDIRCQRLLLQLRWAQATGEQLLREERGRTPAHPAEVQELLAIIRQLNELAGVAWRNRERYLEAVLAWLAKDVSGAFDVWKTLSRASEFEDRSRVVRQLVVTDAAGVPIRYRGRVVRPKGAEDWKVRVEGLSSSITLLAHEFQDEDLAPGRELRGFGIAFNYVGPVADPLSRQARSR